MAYAAIISLANTIDRSLNHNQIYISPAEKQLILSILEYVTSFQAFLENFPDKSNSLEGRMRELAYEAEDIIEYLMLEQVSLCSDRQTEECIIEKVSSSSDNESGCHPSGEHEVQLKKVIGEIALIAGEVKEIKDSFSRKDIQHGADSPTLSSSSTAPPIHKDAVVGCEHYVDDLKERLCGEPSKKLQVISICGMGGSGKTTLAKNVYEDRLIVEHFEIRLWVTISQDFSAQRIFSSLLESLKDFEAGVSGHSDDEKVYKILVGRKYLVVMDDIWSSKAWDAVRKVFPANGEHGSRVLLTTRLLDVASYPDPSSKPCEMGLLNADQSWDLFKQKVFADEDCPSELQDIGKEIAGNCKGLPLAIVVIAGLVSTVSKNPTSWQEIAKNVKSAATAKYNQIEEILCLSYVQLPQYLRPCFLYMASFPEDHEMNVTRLVRLWIAESFVKCPNSTENLEKEAEKWLEDLVKRNLVLVTKRRSDGRIKSCSLHDLMRDLCIRKAHQGKFLLNLMDRYVEKEHSIERIDNERRVSVDSSGSCLSSLSCLSSFSGSAIHTIICRPWRNSLEKNWDFLEGVKLVKVDFLEGVRLVRVLDAEPAVVESPLPAQLFELFHLRYLAIRYNHTIPRALSKLQNLQTLIIRAEMFGIGEASRVLVPWCMPELRHVYFYGAICFNDPRETTPSLENLQTLSYIDRVCCTERILKKIPNVTKLKMNCSGGGDRVKNLVHLHRLENLTLIGRRPNFMFTLPETLKKLTLRDLGIPWNKMTIFGSLPNLQVLKLAFHACSGSTWETTDGEFQKLEFLSISFSDVKDWITESSHFPRLKRLFINYCRFDEIPSAIVEFPSLELVEILDRTIKASLMQSVRRIQEEQEDLGNDVLQVRYLSGMVLF